MLVSLISQLFMSIHSSFSCSYTDPPLSSPSYTIPLPPIPHLHPPFCLPTQPSTHLTHHSPPTPPPLQPPPSPPPKSQHNQHNQHPDRPPKHPHYEKNLYPPYSLLSIFPLPILIQISLSVAIDTGVRIRLFLEPTVRWEMSLDGSSPPDEMSGVAVVL